MTSPVGTPAAGAEDDEPGYLWERKSSMVGYGTGLMEVLRKKKPSPHLVCARCRKHLVALESSRLRPLVLTAASRRAPKALPT